MFFMKRPPTAADITGKLEFGYYTDDTGKKFWYRITGGDIIGITAELLRNLDPKILRVKGSIIWISDIKLKIIGRLDDGTWILKRLDNV